MVRAAGFDLPPASDNQRLTATDSQLDSQSSVVLGHDLSRVVTAWPPALRSAQSRNFRHRKQRDESGGQITLRLVTK